MKDFLELENERYYVRKISGREVEEEKIQKIIKAALAAPPAVNYQPFKIWVLKDEKARKAAAATAPFDFVAAAPVLFVIAADPSRLWHRHCDGQNFADIDTAIVVTTMLYEIHDLGLGTTWVGHFDTEQMKAAFPEMKNYNPIAILPVGYPAEASHPSHLHRECRAEEEMVKYI